MAAAFSGYANRIALGESYDLESRLSESRRPGALNLPMTLREEMSLRGRLETSLDKNSRAKVALIAGILIVLLYAAMRFITYRMFPVDWIVKTIPGVGALYEPAPYKWWVRDTIMDVPRLIAFGLALWVGRYCWGLKQVGWHAGFPVRGLTGGAVAALLTLTGGVLRAKPYDYSAGVLLILAFSSVIVALCEETLFRGVIFKSLYDISGAAWALWGSSALFAIYHVQAQPLVSWPATLMIGLFLAVLRWQGVGLVWLVLSHAVADGVFYLGSYGTPRYNWWPAVEWSLQIGIPLCYYIWATGIVSFPPRRPFGKSRTASLSRSG